MIVGGYVYHVLNRANGRLRLFKKDADFAAFEADASPKPHERVPLRILGYVGDEQPLALRRLAAAGAGRASLRVLSLADDHARPALARPSWHGRHGSRLPGSLQIVSGRQRRTPAGGAALRRTQSAAGEPGASAPRIGDGAACIVAFVGRPNSVPCSARRPGRFRAAGRSMSIDPKPRRKRPLCAKCTARGRPYGGSAWQHRVAAQLNLQYTFRPRGRPRKAPSVAEPS